MTQKKTIDKPVIVLIGPTAVGKTALSIHLAKTFNCEIVGMDSMQIYRHMNIGTAKITREEMQDIPHHLIDICNPDDRYDTNRYVSDCLIAIKTIHDKGKIPLLTGGTGLYLKSLIYGLFEDIGEYPIIRRMLNERIVEKGSAELHTELSSYDPESAKRIHKNDAHRIIRALEIYLGSGRTWSELIKAQKENATNRFRLLLNIGLTTERRVLYDRINLRSKLMLKNGLKEEVSDLLNMGYSRDLQPMQAIGYRHMLSHIFDKWSLEKTLELLSRDTRRYAKRQYTWFSKMDIEWFSPDEISRISTYIQNHKINT